MNEVFVQQLHEVNIATGQEEPGGPVTLGTTTYGPGGEFINNTRSPSSAPARATRTG